MAGPGSLEMSLRQGHLNPLLLPQPQSISLQFGLEETGAVLGSPLLLGP